MEKLLKYFPELPPWQVGLFERLEPLYAYWNARINVISRKDFDLLYERHVLHSLAIAKFIHFRTGTRVLDVGTGGGFPGIPLAIYFPEARFHLVDSIRKKTGVVEAVVSELGLKNVTAEQVRAEQVKGKYDFVVSRAVTNLPRFVGWVKHAVSREQQNALPNGILYLKGGALDAEIRPLKREVYVQDLSEYFEEPFFETKKLVHIPFG